MRISCQQADLYQALSTATHALSAKSPIPALDCVLFEAKDDVLTLTCSDLHLTISCRVPAAIDRDGSVLLPGRLLAEIVRKLPDDEVDIDVSGNYGAKVSALQTRTTLQGMSPDNFPALPEIPTDAVSATISQLTFRDMIRQTAFAVATDDLRPILTGCLLEFEGSALNMVSLDSYRMAMRRAPLISSDGDFSFIAPGKYLNEISRILGDADDAITLKFAGSHMLLNLGMTDIKVRLLDGEYIKYKQIIPQETGIRVIVSKAELSDCVDRASLIAREGKSNLIKMSVSDGKMVVTSNNEMGDIYEVIDVEQYGGDISIAFNVRYLSDVLKNLDDDKVKLLFNTPVSPCVIVPEEGDSFLYLVLPVRTH